MTRFLVLFRSHGPPYDDTIVDIRSTSALRAMRDAKREVHHGWIFARVVPWPRKCADVNEAMSAVSQG